MTILGSLLKNKRAGETGLVWNYPNLSSSETLVVSSENFGDGEPIGLAHAGKKVGGTNISPTLSWSEPPSGTTGLILVVEDADAPMKKPFIHCFALLHPEQLDTPSSLPLGALSKDTTTKGVRLLRNTMGRGYHGPESLKGHGQHRYVFEMFAYQGNVSTDDSVEQTKPREFLSAFAFPILARGRMTGTYER